MTHDERVHAIEAFGFTTRQASFIVTVLLHSGYCVRRQYAEFIGAGYGHNVRDFLDRLVTRQLARRFTYREDRGHIYHLFARPLYAAVQQEDNRNRRHASPALVARKLMLLDFVLSQPTHDWYVTEPEKVTLFTDQLHVPRESLPQRSYEPLGHGDPTVRYCVQKLPVFLAGTPRRVHFVCLVTDPAAREIDIFIRDHAALVSELPSFTLVVVRPVHVSTDERCRAMWTRALSSLKAEPSALDLTSTQWYFDVRQRIERKAFAALTVEHINRYRSLGARVGGRLDRLYTRWLALHQPPVESFLSTSARPQRGVDTPQLVICTLRHRYEQFGSLPGVA